jgi:hypothetical protein
MVDGFTSKLIQQKDGFEEICLDGLLNFADQKKKHETKKSWFNEKVTQRLVLMRRSNSSESWSFAWFS